MALCSSPWACWNCCSDAGSPASTLMLPTRERAWVTWVSTCCSWLALPLTLATRVGPRAAGSSYPVTTCDPAARAPFPAPGTRARVHVCPVLFARGLRKLSVAVGVGHGEMLIQHLRLGQLFAEDLAIAVLVHVGKRHAAVHRCGGHRCGGARLGGGGGGGCGSRRG